MWPATGVGGEGQTTNSLRKIADLDNLGAVRILDVRTADACLAGSLPGARCLPFDHFVGAGGAVIGYVQLRWLLGTVGLQGDETVVVVGARAADSQRVGALVSGAGQRRVWVYDKPFVSSASLQPGTARNVSRETVFTAPMRDFVDDEGG